MALGRRNKIQEKERVLQFYVRVTVLHRNKFLCTKTN